MAGTVVYKHNEGVFGRLNMFVLEEVDKACKAQAQNMVDALRYRRILEGEKSDVRYPRGDGSKNEPTKAGRSKGRDSEPHSYTGWTMTPGKKSMHYNVYNGHKNMSDDYPYPNILIYGMPPYGRAKWKRETAKVKKGPKGRFYSHQMPNGLWHWIPLQRDKLADRIGLISAVWNAKHGGRV